MAKNKLKFGYKSISTLFWDPLKAEFSAKQCGNERVSPSLNDATPTTEEGSPATKPRAIPFRLAGVRRVEG
ncbi:hypothetical protein V6Z12_A08G062400 [Gossypium hirsutum]